MNTSFKIQAEKCATLPILQQRLKLNVQILPESSTTLDCLLNDDVCRQVLQDFATRIHAKNLTCATSLFVKYWCTSWILPFLYCHVAVLPFVKWDSSALVIDLPEQWYWDRTLQLNQTSFYSFQIIHLQEFNDLIEQLNVLFKQLAKIGRVPYVLLWENVAVRVVQFYHSFTTQNLNPDIQSRLEQQKKFFKSKAAESFYLTVNPFVRLWNGWHPEFNTFMRQKCCFYFQLKEAEQTLCRNCPLRLKEIGKFKNESN